MPNYIIYLLTTEDVDLAVAHTQVNEQLFAKTIDFIYQSTPQPPHSCFTSKKHHAQQLFL